MARGSIVSGQRPGGGDTNTMTNKEMREAAGLSQEELADRADVSRSIVAFRERGMRVSAQMEQKIATALAGALDEHSRAAGRRHALRRHEGGSPHEQLPG